MTERKFSRRAFVRGSFLGGAVLSSLSMVGIGIALENSGALAEKPRMEGPLIINNLQLSVLTIGHTREDWNKYSDIVRKHIDTFPVIIPEYFPPEYSGINENFLTKQAKNRYKDKNYLFDEVEAYCRNTKKEVWVVDPAYNVSFMALRAGIFLTEAAGLTGMLIVLKEAIKRRQQTLTRRELLEYVKDFGLATAAFSAGVITPPEILSLMSSQGIIGSFTEDNLRHSVTAQLLKDLSLQVPLKTQALLIYPNDHWENIKEYLNDDEKRRSVLSKIALLKKVPGTKPLFQGRRYVSDGSVWQEQQKIEI